MGLRVLPPPDRLEFSWDEGTVCVLHSNGDPLTGVLARHLLAHAWRVVVLQSGDDVPADGVPRVRVDAAGPGSWEQALAAIDARFGRIAACIDLDGATNPDPEDLLVSHAEERQLTSALFLAGALTSRLTAPDLRRAWYFSVSHLDGELGLAGGSPSRGVVSGGRFALAKTLRQEWPTVFCRALDLHPCLDADAAAALVVGELHDSDMMLAEVGHGPGGRCTVTVGDAAHA